MCFEAMYRKNSLHICVLYQKQQNAYVFFQIVMCLSREGQLSRRCVCFVLFCVFCVFLEIIRYPEEKTRMCLSLHVKKKTRNAYVFSQESILKQKDASVFSSNSKS